MNVLLIRPRPHKDTIGLQNVMICEPLELEYISSNIEPLGHKVTIVDMIIEKKSISYFLKKYKPNVVGITGYISHVNIIKGYAKEIKKFDSKIKIIVGGVHAEVNPEDFESKYIDFIIRANGIRTFIEILDKLENRRNTKRIECVYNKSIKKVTKETDFNYLFPDREKVNKYKEEGKRIPKLGVILVGDNPASVSYVKGKRKACEDTGMAFELKELKDTVSQDELIAENPRLKRVEINFTQYEEIGFLSFGSVNFTLTPVKNM